MKADPLQPIHPKCKGYFAVVGRRNVKLILPPIYPPTIDKDHIDSIMRISIQRVWCLLMPGSGGFNGHVDAIQQQKRLSSPVCEPESSSRMGACPPIPDTPLLRSTRSGTGEIRNAASGQPGKAIGNHGNNAIWFFAGDFLSGGAPFCCRRIDRAAATPKRTTPGVQTFRNCFAEATANFARRTHLVGGGLTTTFRARHGALRSSAQYRTGADPSPKKSFSVGTPIHAPIRSPAILLQDYENLRCQAFQTSNPSLESIILEKQGMAAWMQFIPDHAPVFSEQSLPLSPDLIRVLTNLVIGSHREAQNE